MRQFLPLILVLLVASCDLGDHSDGDTLSDYDWLAGAIIAVANDEQLPESKRTSYRQSAIQLCLQTVRDSTSLPTFLGPTPYRLPDQLIDFYYNVLVHVYNSTSAARDSIVFFYNADYSFPTYSTEDFVIRLEDSTSIEPNWRNGIISSGIPEMDSIVARHDLILDHAARFRPTFYFKTPYPAFLLPLGDSLESFSDVRWAAPKAYGGFGSQIRVTSDGPIIEATYSFGWGDCLSGCIYRRQWKFLVSERGIVEFVESWGDSVVMDRY